MSRVRIDEDIHPQSEFRVALTAFVKQTHDTRHPMVLMQRGRDVAVLVDVHEYERMHERIELLEEVYKAEEQIASGDGIAHGDAKTRVLSKLSP
ncbi:MAG: type II toxin-antitoxin system Phd/YefM family antitoxin [Alcanivorax sp.]|nr:type II toxin-antitoxin system Phd/YefM family antitoxin [Alcanivorax sp.]